jgi:A/G-specific adenine glycosylase
LKPRPQTPDSRLQTRLLAWFDEENRQLPWRGTRDPYRIWISEVMLQQTTVGAVRSRYEAFLGRFPDLTTLARAREQSVLAAWSGLGYYARARNLHSAAREILRRHSGRLPRDPKILRSLPGFGEYTAAAVASLAFGRRVPAADANVTRVLSRLFAIAGTTGTKRHGEAVKRYAEALLDRRRPGDGTAALMDLGQLVCTPRRPDCPACPLADDCAALERGSPERYPRRPARPAVERVFVAAACAARDGRTLLVQRSGSLLRGLWQFPASEARSAPAALRALRHELQTLDLRLDPRKRPIVTRHTIVHRQLAISVYRAIAAPESRSAGADSRSVRWFTPEQLRRAAIPTLTRKIGLASGFLPAAGQRILDSNENVEPASAARRSR